jgi:hypothetical protein
MLYDPTLPCLFEDDEFDDANIDLRGIDCDECEHDGEADMDMAFDSAGLASAGHGMDEDY